MKYTFHALMTCLLVMGLVGCGGFSDHDKNNYERQVSLHKAQMDGINAQVAIIKKALENDAFASAKEEWKSQLNTADTKLKRSDEFMSQAAKEFKTDDKSRRVQLSKFLSAARENRVQTKNSLDAITKTISIANKILDDEDEIINPIKSRAEKIVRTDLSIVNAKLDQIAADFPNKKKYADDKKAAIKSAKNHIATIIEKINSDDILVKANASLGANASINAFGNSIRSVDKDEEELRTSWTKVLSDMDIADTGSRVTYQHLYTKNIIRPDGTHDKEELWENVSELYFEQNENNLGMSIQSKPLGKFENEVEKVAQHAGYNYMAAPGQRNQYGHWRQDNNGNSFWEFYGQYAFMRDMFWGSSYHPVYATEYRDYRSAYDRRQPYYGKTSSGKPRYGSKGTHTAKTYSTSKYKNSRTMNTYKTFRKSGGSTKSGKSFSTSRYSNTGRTTAARVAAQKSSRSSSYGGSRSGGGK